MITAYIRGIPVTLGGGGNGDETPIGTIVSFMGTKAPDGYLICDGAVYNISDYQEFANHISEHFGKVNYFGGDGTATFAVPDLRNMFLRGFHGSADALSGNVGVKQDGSIMPHFYTGYSPAHGYFFNAIMDENGNAGTTTFDEVLRKNTAYGTATINAATTNSYVSAGTIRPVNVAVLYCIKVSRSASTAAAYSEREIMVGTWIDGKPIYRIVVPNVIVPSHTGWVKIVDGSSWKVDTMVHLQHSLNNNGIIIEGNYMNNNILCTWDSITNGINILATGYVGKQTTFIVEYTKKATDAIPTIIPEIDLELTLPPITPAPVTSAASFPTVVIDDTP